MSRTVRLETRGKVHDLREIFDSLNKRCFAGKIRARITWGLRRKPGRKPRSQNSIKMGSYCFIDKLIRIHPSLDRKFVPRYFVEWIVFHEMLHEKHGLRIRRSYGWPYRRYRFYRSFHPAAFNAEEKEFEHYERGKKWEQKNLNRLLVY